MCGFFSLLSDGKGKIMYSDWEFRKKCYLNHIDYEPDDHNDIARYNGYENQSTLNIYKYNPLTKKFVFKYLNTVDDSKEIEIFCNNLDFKTIVAPLIVKPIIFPFSIKNIKLSTEDLKNFQKWTSFMHVVETRGVCETLTNDPIWQFVETSIWESIWDSTVNFVEKSIFDSLSKYFPGDPNDYAMNRCTVNARESVWNAVSDYRSTFFDFKYTYDYGVCEKLFARGFVPSFLNGIWRLHNADGIVWEGSKGDVKDIINVLKEK